MTNVNFCTTQWTITACAWACYRNSNCCCRTARKTMSLCNWPHTITILHVSVREMERCIANYCHKADIFCLILVQVVYAQWESVSLPPMTIGFVAELFFLVVLFARHLLLKCLELECSTRAQNYSLVHLWFYARTEPNQFTDRILSKPHICTSALIEGSVCILKKIYINSHWIIRYMSRNQKFMT